MLKISELPKEAVLFKAGYARTGVIKVVVDTCNICNERKTVIAIDSSEEEYGPGCICEKCAIKLFKEKANGKY